MSPSRFRQAARRFASLVPLLALAAAATAHEFWIQPSRFDPVAGRPFEVRLMVGDGFPGDPVVRNQDRIIRFVAAGPRGEQTIPGQPGLDPAGLARISDPGIYTLAYHSNPSPITLQAAKFEDYLRLEGLEHVIESRAERGESKNEARERFSRCCKSLITVGSADDGFDRTIGLPAELTALDDPRSADPETPIRFRADFDGKPCQGLLVKARSLAHPDRVASARSDANGIVSFRLADPGMWLISTVHMGAAPEDSGAQWDSLWASLTFEVSAPSRPTPSPTSPLLPSSLGGDR